MSDPPTSRSFRSGAGRLCLDFVRTLRYRDRPEVEEELDTTGRLTEWVGLFGPCGPGISTESAVTADSARKLREAIYALLVAAMGPGGARSCAPRHRRLINEWASRQVPAPSVQADGSVHYAAADAVEATLALVARDSLETISGFDARRLRRCSNPDCNIIFLDTSRPGRRRWCSMATCGNQAKKANQRTRHT
jgi:predicted RNA-binding Zn ribbon-like protein